MAFKPRKSITKEEEFINENLESVAEVVQNNLNPEAPRTFKSYTLQLNEFEYNLLDKLSRQEERSMSNVLRIALKSLAKAKELL